MSKWNKTQGVVVPLDSLLKERRKENCPAPRRSAGLVGRWGITSFTSIRSRSYVAEYNNIDLKDPTGLEIGGGVDSSENVVNLLGSNTAEPVRPRKFFKSRNTIPPPPPPPLSGDHLAGHSPYAGTAMPMGGYNLTTTSTTTPPQQHFYQPLSAAAATPQFSPTGPQSANVGHLPPGHPGNDAMAYALHLQQQQQQHLLHSVPLVKEKKGPGRKRKQTVDAAGEPIPQAAVGRKPAAAKLPKKEKKEKRPKKAKKEPVVAAAGDGGASELEKPKRNSSRIRNRVVNYNEDEDSNDYERSVVKRNISQQQQQQQQVVSTGAEYGLPPGVEEPTFEHLQQDPHVTTAYHSTMAVHRQVSSSSSPAGGGYHSGGETRYGKPSTVTTVATPQPSPSEHRPILLRISKGTSMLISTDSEEVSTNNCTPPATTISSNPVQHYQQQQQQEPVPQPEEDDDEDDEDEDDDYDGDLPPRTLLAESEPAPAPPSPPPPPAAVPAAPLATAPVAPQLPASGLGGYPYDFLAQQQQEQQNQATFQETALAASSAQEEEEEATPAAPKSELKIKISLGGKPLISSTTNTSNGTSPSAGSGGSKGGTKYNFKKRAIEREKAQQQHLSSSKRSGKVAPDTDVDGEQLQLQESPAPVSSSTTLKAGVLPGAPTGLPIHQAPPRPSFPLPGTDTYEVFRTLSSLSGGDDFDSQSSILGSASSDNNTPKHTLNAPGEDGCQIIHSRGSSDCGSDLELSQNSSTAAAPPSDVYSESENTQDNGRGVASSTTHGAGEPPQAADFTLQQVLLGGQQQAPPQPAPERVEVLKLNLKHAGARVTRNKMKQGVGEEQQQQQQEVPSQTRAGRTAGRNRTGMATNNNNNVIRGGTRAGKPADTPESDSTAQPPAAVASLPAPEVRDTSPSGARQYSRRKKNVVPPDYHQEPEQDEEEEDGVGNGEMQVSSSRAQPPALPPPATAAAPMRLVLQKKGTIFKSRPLVGSSDGAPDTKKRHVYKHKWDHASGAGAGVPGVGADPNAPGVVGGVAGVVGGPGGVTVGAGDLQHAAPDAAGNGAGLDGSELMEQGLGGGVGGSAGVAGGPLEYDDDFFDGAAGAEHGGAEHGGAVPPRMKRLKLFTAGGGAGVGGDGSGQEAAPSSGGSGAGLPAFGGGTGGADDFYNAGYGYGTFGADAFDEEDDGEEDAGGRRRLRCSRQTRPYYTIVRNVKNSHQMQEIGEFQEMDDDVDYILSALHPDNPIPTRCLSALQLATKCMKPAFKMHVRAHGVVTRFFRALSDAHQDPCLGLCTAAIMYVFSQDKLNMDLDRDSLALMLNLLDTGADTELLDARGSATALTQLQKNRQRVKQLCEEIQTATKGLGGKHIDTDRVTAGTLAMESLLSLTSQRAGEWFKDELRNLGGIERLIKTVAECYEQVPVRAADWTDQDKAKLRKIERCLRVLNNVCLFNRQNQAFLLEYRAGLLVELLVRLYRQVDRDLTGYPTVEGTPKDSIGVLLREMLQPMLHMLITLTHAFDDEAHGAHIVGRQPDVINITMHLLLRVAEYVPQRFVFDLHLLALTLLLHLTRPSQPNRQQVLSYVDSETNRGGIKALVEYFEQQEVMASHAEEKTNAILETPARTVDAEDAETKLMQKAEHHMEHTYMGSHVCMLICQLVMDEPGYQQIARQHLKLNNFKRMVTALTRYYEFLNLTTNADAESTAHKRQTKEAIDYLSQLDGCNSTGVGASSASSGNGCQ